MARTKLVNGQLVDMTPEEEAAFVAALPGPVVPREVSMAQGVIALLRAGITEAMVEAAIAGLPAGATRDEASAWWRRSNAIRRDHPFVAALAPALGLDAAQLDALFIAAAQV